MAEPEKKKTKNRKKIKRKHENKIIKEEKIMKRKLRVIICENPENENRPMLW